MSQVPISVVEAFITGDNEPYTGNPAAVCLLEFDDDIDDATKQKIASTMNLSETAFVAKDWRRSEPLLQGQNNDSKTLKRTLRWFTPKVEVALCGHATVASAKAILTGEGSSGDAEKIEFESKFRGQLSASIDKDLITLNFPLNTTQTIPLENSTWLPQLVRQILGPNFENDDPLNELVDIEYCEYEKILVFRLKKKAGQKSVETIKNVKPNFQQLAQANTGDLVVDCHIVTIEGDDDGANFYSRFFTPLYGINEDPVTGMAHTILTPYWTKQLKLKTLKAHQASVRGGDLVCHVDGDRVQIGGRARVALRGQLHL